MTATCAPQDWTAAASEIMGLMRDADRHGGAHAARAVLAAAFAMAAAGATPTTSTPCPDCQGRGLVRPPVDWSRPEQFGVARGHVRCTTCNGTGRRLVPAFPEYLPAEMTGPCREEAQHLPACGCGHARVWHDGPSPMRCRYVSADGKACDCLNYRNVKREPTVTEMQAALGDKLEVQFDGWTIRRCCDCVLPVPGGRTRCDHCTGVHDERDRCTHVAQYFARHWAQFAGRPETRWTEAATIIERAIAGGTFCADIKQPPNPTPSDR